MLSIMIWIATCCGAGTRSSRHTQTACASAVLAKMASCWPPMSISGTYRHPPRLTITSDVWIVLGAALLLTKRPKVSHQRGPFCIVASAYALQWTKIFSTRASTRQQFRLLGCTKVIRPQTNRHQLRRLKQESPTHTLPIPLNLGIAYLHLPRNIMFVLKRPTTAEPTLIVQ